MANATIGEPKSADSRADESTLPTPGTPPAADSALRELGEVEAKTPGMLAAFDAANSTTEPPAEPGERIDTGAATIVDTGTAEAEIGPDAILTSSTNTLRGEHAGCSVIRVEGPPPAGR